MRRLRVPVTVGFLLGFACVLVIFFFSSDMAAGVIGFAFRKVGGALTDNNGLITAVATIFIAWFTLTLRRSTDKLWDAAKSSADLAAKDFDARLRPMLVVEFEEPDKIKPFWNGEPEYRFRDEVTFRIKNVGGGVAVLTGLYRTWAVCDSDKTPEPVERPYRGEPGFWKNNIVAIGSGQYSGAVKSMTNHTLKKLRPINGGDRVFFYGYFEYEDLAEHKYVSGFCQLFDTGDTSMGFHIPWPEKGTGAKYNYHKRL